jgi:hypothetical protein
MMKNKWSILAIIYIFVVLFASTGRAQNLLQNPNFELGKSGWKNSGGTFAIITSTNVLEGKQSASFLASGSSQYLETNPYTVPQGLYGENCMASFKYKGGDANLYLTVMDGASAEIIPTNARATLSVATNQVTAKIYFTCPSSGQLKFRLVGTASAAIAYLDNAELGKSDAVPVKQSQMFGTARWAANPLCIWPINNTGVGIVGAFLTPSVDNDCNDPVLTGNALAPLTKLPAIRFSNAPAGTYKVTINGNFRISANEAVMSISDGVNIGSSRTGLLTATWTNSNTMTSEFRYTTSQPSLSFFPVMNAISGSPNVTIGNEENTQDETAFGIIVEYYPLEGDIVSNARCVNPIDCENVFWARISPTGVVDGENLNWINGNCTVGAPAPSGRTCTFNSGIFSILPKCQISVAGGSATSARIESLTNTTIIISSWVGNVNTNDGIQLTCSKDPADYKPRQEIKGFFSSMLSPVAFYATQNNSQVIPNVTPTTVIYNLEGYDTHNAYNPATGIFTVPEAGKYRCTCQAATSGTFGTNTLNIYLTVNPTSTIAEAWTTTNGTNTYTTMVTAPENYTVGKEIYCRYAQNSGGSKSLNASGQQNFFACEKVAN